MALTMPRDWTRVRLGDVATVARGASPRPIASTRWFSESSDVGWVRIADVGRSDGITLLNTTQRLSQDGIARSRYLEPGTLIMSIAATVGVPVITGIPTCIHDGFVAIDKLRDVDQTYLLYALKSGQDELRLAGQTGSQSNVNSDIVKRMKIALPPLSEQKAIAGALLDCDHLIDELERMIAKKQKIREGMLQRAFESRDPQMNRETLGSIAAFLSGGTPDRGNADYWSGSIPWISASSLKEMEVSTSDQKVTELAVRAGSRMAPLGSTLLLVRGSALHSEIRAALVSAPACFNQDVKALVPKSSVEPKFLTYSIHANAVRLLRLVTSAGNTAGVLDTRVLKSFDIWLPGRDEQRDVVSVFDDVTSEIGLLSDRVAKARSVKTGMMQQLLTGRTRLPIEGMAV